MNNFVNTMNNSFLLVDTGVICDNAKAIMSSLTPGAKLIPVLKSDAYGMGLVPVAKALAAVAGIDCFAVAHVSEGLELRTAGIAQDILVMGYYVPGQERTAAEAGLTLTCGRGDMIDALAQIGKQTGHCVKVQIKIDTGLHRIGAQPGEQLARVAKAVLRAGECVSATGAFTHFADLPDEVRTKAQYELFLRGIDQLEAAGVHIPMRHVSSSAISEYHPEYDLDAVRIGRRLYMDHPTMPLGTIKEAASWRAYITDINHRRAGEGLGYGGKVTLEQDTLVATIGVGYGDGLNQALVEARAPVLVGGQKCLLLACCMDQSFVDVSGMDCRPGDEVTLFGYDSEGNFLSSQAVSLYAGDDEGCGLTSALSGRVARIYK